MALIGTSVTWDPARKSSGTFERFSMGINRNGKHGVMGKNALIAVVNLAAMTNSMVVATNFMLE